MRTASRTNGDRRWCGCGVVAAGPGPIGVMWLVQLAAVTMRPAAASMLAARDDRRGGWNGMCWVLLGRPSLFIPAAGAGVSVWVRAASGVTSAVRPHPPARRCSGRPIGQVPFRQPQRSRADRARRRGRQGVVIVGASIARQCLTQGLADEILIHLVPIVLGNGIRLFASSSAPPVILEPASVGQSGELTDLRFRVIREQPASRRA
jgi:hypothetical protein